MGCPLGISFVSLLKVFQPLEVIIVDVFLCGAFSLCLKLLTTTTLTPPVTDVCPGAMLIADCYTDFHFCGSNNIRSETVVLPGQLIPKDMVRISVSLTSMLQQQQLQSQMPSQAYANYAKGLTLVNFQFQCSASHWFIVSYVGDCYCVSFLLSGSHVDSMFISGDSTLAVCNITTLLSRPWQAYLPLCGGPWPMPGIHWVAATSTALSS